jgi:DNA mismatch repair protein MutL
VDRTYLVVAEPHGLLLIDQHAAHERILYQAMRTGTVEKRPLAMPVSLDLHPAESEEMQRISPELKRLGFEFRFETQEKILLTATPAWLSAAGAAETLKALAGGQGKTRDDILVTLACHRAIKAGDSLDDVEAAQLLRQWWRCPERSYCPHGRPAAVRFQRTDLDKLFKRIK